MKPAPPVMRVMGFMKVVLVVYDGVLQDVLPDIDAQPVEC